MEPSPNCPANAAARLASTWGGDPRAAPAVGRPPNPRPPGLPGLRLPPSPCGLGRMPPERQRLHPESLPARAVAPGRGFASPGTRGSEEQHIAGTDPRAGGGRQRAAGDGCWSQDSTFLQGGNWREVALNERHVCPSSAQRAGASAELARRAAGPADDGTHDSSAVSPFHPASSRGGVSGLHRAQPPCALLPRPGFHTKERLCTGDGDVS